MSNLSSTVHIDHAFDKDSVVYYPVLVVSAGAAGVALGCRLKEKLGSDQFRIFDRQSGIGGNCSVLIIDGQGSLMMGRDMVDQPLPRRGRRPGSISGDGRCTD